MKTLTHTCPVCGKPILDYHSQDVVCPACNTDLSIYRTIDSIHENTLWRGWLYVAIVALVATIAITTALFTSSKSHNTQIEQLEKKVLSYDEENERLVGTITDYATMVKEQQRFVQGFPYVIRKGDCLWLISKRLYGIGTYAKQIADDNNISLDTPLNVGDTLYIKY